MLGASALRCMRDPTFVRESVTNREACPHSEALNHNPDSSGILPNVDAT